MSALNRNPIHLSLKSFQRDMISDSSWSACHGTDSNGNCCYFTEHERLLCGVTKSILIYSVQKNTTIEEGVFTYSARGTKQNDHC